MPENLKQKNFFPRKSPLQQAMTPSDWVKLAVLLVFSVGCWAWVWYAYSQPLDYQSLTAKYLNEAQAQTR